MKLAEQMEIDFAELTMPFGKMQGQSELNIRLITILFLNKEAICINELSRKTGYSLSSISTAMKTLETLRKVVRVKKPGDKKVYYTANRDALGTMKTMFRHFKEAKDQQINETIPTLYKKYSHKKELKEKVQLLEDYEKQLKLMGKIMDEMLEKLEAL